MCAEKPILLIAGGSEACLDVPDLVRALRVERLSVRVALSRGARAFFGERTVPALTGHEPMTLGELTGGTQAAGPAVALWAPLTPDDLAADEADLWLGALRSAAVPVIVCPCPGQASTAIPSALARAGLSVRAVASCAADAVTGCPRVPLARVVESVAAELSTPDLAGRRILITAGPTVEDLDPVRFISNRSSGRMGVALARAAARRGAAVTVVHGPLRVPLPDLPTVTGCEVRSAREMHEAVMAGIGDADAAIFCAAVADFTPAAPAAEKIKKDRRHSLALELVRTPDILADAGTLLPRPVLVGFAAESRELERYARAKMIRKNCDLLCANNIAEPGSGFGGDTNRITIYRRDDVPVRLPKLSKLETAHRILDRLQPLLAAPRSQTGPARNPPESQEP